MEEIVVLDANIPPIILNLLKHLQAKIGKLETENTYLKFLLKEL